MFSRLVREGGCRDRRHLVRAFANPKGMNLPRQGLSAPRTLPLKVDTRAPGLAFRKPLTNPKGSEPPKHRDFAMKAKVATTAMNAKGAI